MVYRVYVEKKPPYAVEATALQEELSGILGIRGLEKVRLVHRYDVQGISKELFDACVPTVFSEPPVDEVYTELPAADWRFGVEYLPGQFDQRADSAAECIQLISQQARPLVRSAKMVLVDGTLTQEDRQKIIAYMVNPVESCLANLAPVDTLQADYPAPPDVPMVQGFCALPSAGYEAFRGEYGLAMDAADLAFCQQYFQSEGREPTLTELRMIDTYWSDHCRHTTFGTLLQDMRIEDERAKKTYDDYLALRQKLGRGEKPVTLMDMATIGARALKAEGKLPKLDESEEINACSVHMQVDNGGRPEDWLLLFKNETHNHPTEIEPFGGAATCIGGAIRDPLANRGYVFGALRITGAGDPLQPVAGTLPGKLPQRKLVQTAARGYSSYGNQIGLATGLVREIYHPGYVAKRMELGAVLGAVPLQNVRREAPRPGDVVLLLGGRTGRDGCGGATGSSKAHKIESLATCGAEVQKGNPPMERKLQRLFRTPEALRLIRRCNDFGAGGVSVAIGELADGLRIDLDAVPKKYDGLNGTEIAISESQERMAVVVAPEDTDAFIALAAAENLEATPVATVTEHKRLVMQWRGRTIVDIDRGFLNSNGATRTAGVYIPALPTPEVTPPIGETAQQRLAAWMGDVRRCGQKGLSEMFDSTIGAGSVLMPFGGKYQLSPTQAMVLKVPVEGETDTCAGMAYGFDPYVSKQNPYEGARCAVYESVAKLAAYGFSTGEMYLSFQEYFGRPGGDAGRWGQPTAALLGALQAQLELGIAAIGGKDSMSGSFEDLDVPPTLVSLAVAPGSAGRVNAGHLQAPYSPIVLLRPLAMQGVGPQPAAFKMVLAQLDRLITEGRVLSVRALGFGGIAEGLFLMGLGNRLGVRFAPGFDAGQLYTPALGSFLVELADAQDVGIPVGESSAEYTWQLPGESVDLAAVQQVYEGRLAPIFPYRIPTSTEEIPTLIWPPEGEDMPPMATPKVGMAKPRALIPVFPGTNCEYDTARALRRAGAEADIFVVQNQTPRQVEQSAAELARRIAASQMLVLPGGFSGGDEPEGSAKLIAAFFRGQQVARATTELLEQRDGLILGICNGFQALVKLGLLPGGHIAPLGPGSPTLTFNRIGRHQSGLVRTRVASCRSPWLCKESAGAIHTVAVSHGEGRFVADEATLQALAQNGQIATQYVDFEGNASMEIAHNPNGSAWAIEGICSPDGRVLGKMGHSERSGEHLYVNVAGNKYQALFEGGVAYFSL